MYYLTLVSMYSNFKIAIILLTEIIKFDWYVFPPIKSMIALLESSNPKA